jgi:L-ascorbate 6-phosphate lactonase
MIRLAQRIRQTRVEPGSLAIFWISQAGFIYKTPAGQVIYVDPYLTDSVHRQLSTEMYGFKRIMMTPIEPEEVEADVVVCTHSHPDHFDADAIPAIAARTQAHFVGAPDCRAEFEKVGVPAGRYTILRCGETWQSGDCAVTAVFADHGELAPDAQGMLITVGDIRVWQVADTAYRPDMWQDLFGMGLDVIIPPINGAFGNLDGVQAARLAGESGAKIAIPCHFWMFAEHGGSPAQFLDACRDLAPHVTPLLMSQGELFVYHKA